MNTVLYIRDFSEKLTFSNLTPIERLLLSIHLTKYVERDNRDSVEILFSLTKDLQGDSYRRWLCYKDYVEADDKMKQSSRSFLFDNVIRQAKESLKDLHYVKIDLEKLNMNGKCSLYNIAFKAFVIGASMHTCKEENVNWFDIPLRCWCNCPTKSLSRIWNEISNWLDENGIKAERREKWLHVFNKYGQSGQKLPEKFTKKEVINIFEENMKKVEEAKKITEEEIINNIKENAIKEAQELRLAPAEIIEEDEDQDIIYQDFQKKYGAKLPKILLYITQNVFDITKETEKIAKQYETTREVVMRFYETGYVKDEDGGLKMKNALRQAFIELKNKIDCLAFDESWMNGNLILGKIFKSYIYHTLPKLKGIN